MLIFGGYVYFVGDNTHQELIRLIRQSDYEAFEVLDNRFWPGLHKLAYKKAGDLQDTYNLLQDMFIELLEKWEELHLGGMPQGWLQKRSWFELSTYFRTRGCREEYQVDFRIILKHENTTILDGFGGAHEIGAYYGDLLSAINKTIEEMYRNACGKYFC